MYGNRAQSSNYIHKRVEESFRTLGETLCHCLTDQENDFQIYITKINKEVET